MEDQTAFDLNVAVQRWREQLARSSAFRTENLNELESHLRDSFDRLRARELSDEEAFLIATRRLGNARKLEREFGKMNNAAIGFDRFLWIFVAIQLWFLVSSASLALLGATLQNTTNVSDVQPLVLAMVFAPIPIGIVTVMVWRYLIWPLFGGGAIVQKFLGRPAGVALTLFVLGALLTLVATWALRTWCYPIILQHIGYPDEMQMRVFYMCLPYLAFWAVVTFFIARKRLKSRAA